MRSEQSQAEETRGVARLLAALVSVVCRFPAPVLALALLLAAVSLYLFSTRLTYRTQRGDLLNPNKDHQKRWRQYIAEFGDDDDLVVVVKTAAAATGRARMKQALDTLAEKIRRQPEHFDRLFYKVDLRHLQDRALLFLPAAQVQTIQENLQSMDRLLRAGQIGWDWFTLYNLVQEARQRLGRLTPGQELSQADVQFLTQLLAISRSAKAALDDPTAYRNPWRSLVDQPPEQEDLLAEPQYFFSGDGVLAFLLARPIKEPGSFTAAYKSVAALRDLVTEVRGDFPDLEIGLTGLPVLETDEMVAAERDTRLASWLAIAGVTMLFFAVYRGIWYPLLTVTTLLVGTAWAMGWMTLTVGHLNILSATFAVMLIGMGDYGVLWVMRYEQARRRGADVRAALLHTARHVAVGNLTAATTLALAFFAAMLADFQAVVELGWIAGSGVLLCALACFTVLPALAMLCDRRGHPDKETRRQGDKKRDPVSLSPCLLVSLSPCQQSWLPWLSNRPRWVIAAGLALMAVLGVFACRVQYDHNLLHLQPRNLESVRWELTLIEHTAGASWHALSYTDTAAEALALKAQYEKLPEVSRVVEVATLVPPDQEAKLEQLADIRHRLRYLPPRGVPIRHARPSSQAVMGELACVIDQLQPLAEAASQPLLADLRGSLDTLHDQLVNVPEVEVVEEHLQEFERRMLGDLAEDLHRLHDVSKPVPADVADLPPELRERYISPNGKWLLRVFAKEGPDQCLWDFGPLEHFCRQIQTVDPEATGKPFGTVEGLQGMKNGFQWAGVYAFLAIVSVLLADFRSLRTMLLALVPLAMGLVLTLGILGLFGLPLNPANMIAFPLILGVGVDNGVHVIHDYLLRRAEGRATISHAIGRGVLVKALTTMIGFGTLMVSSQRGLVSLGFILTAGVGCCLLTALVFLPAVLRLGGRRKETVVLREMPVAPLCRAA